MLWRHNHVCILHVYVVLHNLFFVNIYVYIISKITRLYTVLEVPMKWKLSLSYLKELFKKEHLLQFFHTLLLGWDIKVCLICTQHLAYVILHNELLEK